MGKKKKKSRGGGEGRLPFLTLTEGEAESLPYQLFIAISVCSVHEKLESKNFRTHSLSAKGWCGRGGGVFGT